MNTLNTTQDALGTVAHSVGDIVTEGGEFVADLASDLAEVAEAAVSTIAATSVVGIRALGRTVAFAARRPREVVAGVVVVAVVVALVGYLKSRSADPSGD
jgi:hypothetical protein